MTVDDSMARAGLTDQQAASLLNVSREAVRLWRRGQRRMLPRHARALHASFGIPLHELRPDVWDAPHQAEAA